MAEVTSYGVLFYGSPTGYQTNRAQIYLSDVPAHTLADLQVELIGFRERLRRAARRSPESR
jgi:hypothetical protein